MCNQKVHWAEMHQAVRRLQLVGDPIDANEAQRWSGKKFNMIQPLKPI